MSERTQEKDDARVSLSAFVDRDLREQLGELARAEDRSVSAIVRRALVAELQREAEEVAP